MPFRHRLYQESLESVVSHVWVEKFVTAASLCLCYYDYLLCLEREVAFIWRRGFSIAKVLYILTRYTTLLELPVSVIYAYGPGVNRSFCERWSKITLVVTMVSAIALAGILTLRTWIVWGNSRKILWTMSVCCALCLMGMFGGFILLMVYTDVAYIPELEWMRVCAFIGTEPSLFVFFAFESLMVIIAFILGWPKFYGKYRTRQDASICVLMLEDGYWHVLIMLAAVVLNVSFWLNPHPDLRKIPLAPFKVLSSIMSSRLIFVLHKSLFPNNPSSSESKRAANRACALGQYKGSHFSDSLSTSLSHGHPEIGRRGPGTAGTSANESVAISAFEVRTGPYSYEGASPTASFGVFAGGGSVFGGGSLTGSWPGLPSPSAMAGGVWSLHPVAGPSGQGGPEDLTYEFLKKTRTRVVRPNLDGRDSLSFEDSDDDCYDEEEGQVVGGEDVVYEDIEMVERCGGEQHQHPQPMIPDDPKPPDRAVTRDRAPTPGDNNA